jgi:2-isopropylmalate synthase
VAKDGVDHVVSGAGNGPIEAFIGGFRREFDIQVRIADYEEHAIGDGANAQAICFVEAQVAGAPPAFGAGIDGSIVRASLNAIISAVNRSMHQETKREVPAAEKTGATISN